MSRYVAVIEGLSGNRRVLARDGKESGEAKRARIFRSHEAGSEAAQAYVATFPSTIASRLRYAVIEEERLRAVLEFEEAACNAM